MNRTIFRALALCLAGAIGFLGLVPSSLGQGNRELADGFMNPPDTTKPWVYWYWISDNISREGITRDLEAMKRVGIGEALIGNIFLDDVEIGGVKALSEEWWGMVEHAIREGGRLGVDIGMFNCPGWSQSGGPWIQPDQAMRYMASMEVRVRGPQAYKAMIMAPDAYFQDVALLAFPAPKADTVSLAEAEPVVQTEPEVDDAELLADGGFLQGVMLPQGQRRVVVDLKADGPFVARSLILNPSKTTFSCSCTLQVQEPDGTFRTVRTFPVDRSNAAINVGFIPHAPVSVSFPRECALVYRLVFENISGRAGFTEIELLEAARVERFMEKQLAKMHPTPLPMWDTYLWDQPTELDDESLAVPVGEVIDITDKMNDAKVIEWAVPEGDWVIVRMGMTPTGTKNAPASPEGQGLEVDKMNREAARAHFEAYIGELLERMPAEDRRAFRHVIADSYEMGSQNWTDGFDERFRAQFGYDPVPWLPVLTGRVVGSAEESERFLWDLRRMVADGVAYDYVGGLRDVCNEHGLLLWLENYGHWGFPAEFLQYGGQADHVSGEFWATGDLGSIELRAASSAAHIYGKPIVSAEAFTSGLRFESTPWSLKPRGDWALTEGINHWVLHVYIHQPWEDRLPGVNAWFSTEFNRHNTWFEQTREWIDYYRRCDFLLQQGTHVADVAYYIGDDTPKMTGVRNPPLPDGYDFDYINGEVIRQRLETRDGRFVLPEGKSYRLLVLPDLETMRPEVLGKIEQLVRAGGVILGPKPVRSPSMENYPACDQIVRELAEEIWGDCDGKTVTSREYGEGRVFNGLGLDEVFAEIGLAPDLGGCPHSSVSWTHRTTGDRDIYFLSNQSAQPISITPVFRAAGKIPSVWNPERAEIRRVAVYEPVSQGVRVPLELEAYGSVFVVFGPGRNMGEPVLQVKKDGEILVSTAAKEEGPGVAGDDQVEPGTFVMAGWVRPDVDIGLPGETDTGVFNNLPRNEAVVPTHGDSIVAGGGHAGAGISVGRNGVVVYEHGANYYVPILVKPIALTGWTHLAVAYQNGRPSLYINGELAHQGKQSRYTVHPGQLSGGAFKGGRSEFLLFGGALEPDVLVELVEAAPPDVRDSNLPVLTLERRGRRGGLEAVVSENGRYDVAWRNGQVLSFSVDALTGPAAIEGGWTVEFEEGRGAPASLDLPALVSLTEVSTNEAVRYYSGTAVYHKDFVMPGELDPEMKYYLDLGRVESIAEVSLNDQPLGTFWKPPYLLEITEALEPGENRLEVRVTSTWRNRLIGDAKYPDGMPGAVGEPFETYLTADIGISPNEAPSPFGLIGPVRVQAANVVRVRQP